MLLFGLINIPLVLNANIDAIIDIGMTKTSLAIVYKITYFLEFVMRGSKNFCPRKPSKIN